MVKILVATGLLCLTWPASAHDSADWIRRGGYKSQIGEACCGERDCIELGPGDVKVTAGGYLIIRTGELIPFKEATPSPTATYWLCAWAGRRKCFFSPPTSF